MNKLLSFLLDYNTIDLNKVNSEADFYFKHSKKDFFRVVVYLCRKHNIDINTLFKN